MVLLAILGAVGEALTRSGSATTATLLRIPSAGGGEVEFGLPQVSLVLSLVVLLFGARGAGNLADTLDPSEVTTTYRRYKRPSKRAL